MKIFTWLFIIVCLQACNGSKNPAVEKTLAPDTIVAQLPDTVHKQDTLHVTDTLLTRAGSQDVFSGNVFADSLVTYAETLKGIPYKYASIDPKQGFDCSGFITYVFTKFGINVPRSSRDFENVGRAVWLFGAKRGDLVLFTGTDTTDKTIGHMGIVTSNEHGQVNFIHSTSGKANGVTISLLNEYYLGRYVKTVRVFNQ